MTVKTLADLKARFETGDTPTAQDFIDFLDSFLHAGLGNFPDPLPAVSGADLEDIGDALPDPLPARDGSALTNINPKEYNVPGSMPVPSYATANTFVLSGDFTVSAADVNNRVFLIGRRLRIQIGGAYEYTEVSNAVFAAGITTVTTLNNMSGSPIQEVAVGVITPFALGGAVGPGTVGAAGLASNNVFTGNNIHAGTETFNQEIVLGGSTEVGTANSLQQVAGNFIYHIAGGAYWIFKGSGTGAGYERFKISEANGIVSCDASGGEATGSFPGAGKSNWHAVFSQGLELKPNPLGAPTARAANTQFQAATDLIVIYTCSSGGGGVPAGAQGITDASNPPVTQRSAVTSDTTYGGGGPGISTGGLCVRKGEYWKVVNNGTSTIFEYPVGT